MKQAYKIPNDKNQCAFPFSTENRFDAWAHKYFNKRRLNKFIPYSEALKNFRTSTNSHLSSLKFKKGLTNWCQNKGFELDPKDLQNSGRRIIRKCKIGFEKSIATEMLYIRIDNFLSKKT